MEEEASQRKLHTAGFDKRKKKTPVSKERPQQLARESFGESSPATKRKKRKKGIQHLESPPWKDPETPEEVENATRTHKKKKKRRGVSEVDQETGVYVIVDKENIENLRKVSRKHVDIVYVDANKKQKPRAARGEELPTAPRAGGGAELPKVAKSGTQGAQEPRQEGRKKRKKKKKQQPGSVPSPDAVQESQPGSPSPLQPGASTRGPWPAADSADQKAEVAQSPRAGKKSKKKKKKALRNQELEAPPAGPEDAHPEGEVGTAQGPEVLEGVGGTQGVKKKSKKRKRAPAPLATCDDGDVTALGSNAENLLLDSPRARGTLPEENVDRRPKKAKGQACSPQQRGEETPRSEPAAEEESNLESTSDPAAGYLSEDSRDSEESDVDLGSAVRQLQEFIPGIRERAAATIKRMYRDDLGRFKEFKAQGVAIRFGKFSAKENKQIEKNVQEFLSLTRIESADKLLHTDRYPEEKSLITNLKRKHAFRLHIGKGIARPWKLVYYRAKKMFDMNNYKGRYSKGDTEKLKVYHSLHGNDWKKIGAMVERSSLSVALKFSQIGSQRNHGSWSKTETQKLIKAVEEVILKKMSSQELKELDSKLQENPEGRLSIVREKLYKGISWVEVGAKVETRNWMQCKSKWTEILTKRMTRGGFVYRGVNALHAKINLIERLYELNVEDANEINWEDLASTIGDVPPSYVQVKFYKLKAACVPFWQKKTFPEIIDYLYERSLPLLKEKLNKKLEKKDSQIQTPAAPKQDFLFKDIFYCEDDSEGEDGGEHS